MKNIKNTYINSLQQAGRSSSVKLSCAACKSLPDEKLTFKEVMRSNSKSFTIEDGDTRRKLRRIVEKRICSEYWKTHSGKGDPSNKHRAATRRYVSKITRRLFKDYDNKISFAA